MRKAHPNGVQGRRKINHKKDRKRRDEIADLQRWLKGKK